MKLLPRLFSAAPVTLAALLVGAAPARGQTPPRPPNRLEKPKMQLMQHSAKALAPQHITKPSPARPAVPARNTPPSSNTPRSAANGGSSGARSPDDGAPGLDESGTTPNNKRDLDRKKLAQKGKFKLKFDKVDIDELVKQVADMTGKQFILPENIRGKISIIGPEHGEAWVTADEVYAAFLSALDANGLTVYSTGKFLRIEEKRQGKQSNIPTFIDPNQPYPLSEQMITKLFRVKYVDAEPIRGVLAGLVTQNGDVSVFAPDLLIINDQGLNMHRLDKIIEQLDQPGGTDTIHIVQVQFAAASDMADKLTKIFDTSKKAPGQRPGQVNIARARPQARKLATPAPAADTGSNDSGGATLRLVIPDERTNKLVIIANDKSFEKVQDIIRDLDVPTAGEGGVHVYYLQNAAAEDLSNTLSTLAQGTQNRQGKGKAAKPGGAAELFSGEVKVTAEKSTNSLVIIASDTDYRNLVKVIEKLDLPRREVFVEAVIMEVDLDHDDKIGGRVHTGVPPIQTNLFGAKGDAVSLLGDKFGGDSLPPSFSLASLLSFQGFLAGLQGPLIPELSKLGINVPSFGVLLHAIETSSDVNVLSTPHILTTDNEEAEITVGQNVPFQAGFSPSSLGSSLGSVAGAAGGSSALGGLGGLLGGGGLGSFFAPIQRQNVELKLKIKPQINEGDMIRMTIDEQTEEIASSDPVLGPTTSKRSAKTTIIVQDQQTVVIGGMIQERTINSVNKVPILGDIPILGHLFREDEHHKIRTNLLLFLTPYIIRDQSDFERIFRRKLQERQDFVEEFYGHEKQYEAYIDYQRKSGPLSHMRSTLRGESNKIENGGSGVGTGEKAIVPSSKSNAPSGPPSGRSDEGDQTGEAPAPETPGAETAPAPEATPEVAEPPASPEHIDVQPSPEPPPIEQPIER